MMVFKFENVSRLKWMVTNIIKYPPNISLLTPKKKLLLFPLVLGVSKKEEHPFVVLWWFLGFISMVFKKSKNLF
jgi:hypothetical protein